MSSSYRNSLNAWLNQLDVTAHTVLDIGGAQEPLPSRVRSWQVDNYVIADLPQPHKDSPLPDIALDLNYFWNTQIDTNHMGMYDRIFCLEVFDYIFDPTMALLNIKHLLADGGTAWITFPSVYPAHQPIEDDALRYMIGGIRKLMDHVGLQIITEIPRHTETNALYQAFLIERMRCAKRVDHTISGWIIEVCR